MGGGATPFITSTCNNASAFIPNYFPGKPYAEAQTEATRIPDHDLSLALIESFGEALKRAGNITRTIPGPDPNHDSPVPLDKHYISKVRRIVLQGGVWNPIFSTLDRVAAMCSTSTEAILADAFARFDEDLRNLTSSPYTHISRTWAPDFQPLLRRDCEAYVKATRRKARFSLLLGRPVSPRELAFLQGGTRSWETLNHRCPFCNNARSAKTDFEADKRETRILTLVDSACRLGEHPLSFYLNAKAYRDTGLLPEERFEIF